MKTKEYEKLTTQQQLREWERFRTRWTVVGALSVLLAGLLTVTACGTMVAMEYVWPPESGKMVRPICPDGSLPPCTDRPEHVGVLYWEP